MGFIIFIASGGVFDVIYSCSAQNQVLIYCCKKIKISEVRSKIQMKTLIIADVHANIEAFRAVIADAGEVDRTVFLGDIANFGANPSECVDLLRELGAINIIGNHDEAIVSQNPKHFWDKWAKGKLSENQLGFMETFAQSVIIDGHILAVHGSYTVPYDILPNTPDEDMVKAFSHLVTQGIDEVWFGHYHYGIDRVIDGVAYRCIRPVGHHRDKDVRAGYSIYENGKITHKRVEYDIEATVGAIERLDCFESEEIHGMFVEFTKNAYHEELLKKDIVQMKKNDELTKDEKSAR